jgi:nitrogen fixation-related uncharacterized protein
MPLLDALVERRIAEAMADGQFDDLPGAGKPLQLDDDALVPEELRVAHRILRNAGFLPPEVAVRRDIADAAALLRCAADDGERRRAALRVALLAAKLEAEGRALPVDYRDLVTQRMGRASR